ncbi:MAG TPA: carboxypeptidase-like regulatory domain-containing protein [Thermoanaerobaculia bacterium]|jgi:hypothetical protein
MTLRSRLFVSAIVMCAVFAAGPKRRAVAPALPAGLATLAGTVTDTSTGAAVAQVQVIGAGKVITHSDATGNFTLKMSTGRDVPLTLTRTGYEPVTINVNISGDATRAFQLAPKPTVKVRTIAGTTYEVDTESVEFGSLAPFSGYTKDTKLNLCKAGGTPFVPDRAEIRRLAGPAQLNDAACCNSGSIPAINVELKAGGGTSTAAFVDACFGYKVDVIALDHKTAEPVYIHFSDIAEVTFP